MPDSPRAHLGQLSWFVRANRDPERWRRQLAVRRAVRLPDLPLRRPDPRQVWAVAMVRDEADVVEAVVEHLLGQGVDRVLVVDHLSRDTTPDLLRALAGRHPGRVLVGADREPRFLQVEKMSRLVRWASLRGAGWVVPFDADELWFAERGSLAGFLRSTSADIVHADFHPMVPTTAAPTVRRETEFVLDATPSLPGKVAVRAHPLVTMRPGNHDALRVGTPAGGLRIAHALYRGPDQVARKLRQGMTAAAAQDHPDDEVGVHWERGARLSDAEIAEVWRAVSAGEAEPRIAFEAHGPMVRVRPLTWSTWDPDGQVPSRPGRWFGHPAP